MKLNIDQFMDSLPIMAKGMGGILIVTAIIVATILILNAVTKDKESK